MAIKIQLLPYLYIKIKNPLSVKILTLFNYGSKYNLITLKLALKCSLTITQLRITLKGLYSSLVPFTGET